MEEIWVITILFAVGLVILVAELFLPSHGALTVAALVFLAIAVVKTFRYGTVAGVSAIAACLVLLPVMFALTVKYWPRTSIGRRMAPPNPIYAADDFASHAKTLEPLLGKYGQSLSALRPVGTCEFAGRRIECLAEMGMIEPNRRVQATGIQGQTLTVRAVDS